MTADGCGSHDTIFETRWWFDWVIVFILAYYATGVLQALASLYLMNLNSSMGSMEF